MCPLIQSVALDNHHFCLHWSGFAYRDMVCRKWFERVIDSVMDYYSIMYDIMEEMFGLPF